MRRGDSYIFQKESGYKKVRNYNSPFDVVLTKRFTNAKIEKFEVAEGNRILRIYVQTSSKYKSQPSVLQFEFTGRNTNVIILDENEMILEAFRHIDMRNSYREVKVGIVLEPLPPREIKERVEPLTDIKAFLRDEYKRREESRLVIVKNQKILTISKKLKKLQKNYERLENEDDLLEKSRDLEMDGNLLLSNLHNMKNYQKEIEVLDYEGNSKIINLPEDVRTPSEAANRFFTRSKKLKQKAKNTYIERENLDSKITFLKRLQERLGKNEKGNITLLKEAKMSDIWMHIKDMPSTHVIIRNDKKNVPDSVLEFGAKLCVQFSAVTEGSYLVDYTYRRNVKMREGANVNYVEYKTLKITKD